MNNVKTSLCFMKQSPGVKCQGPWTWVFFFFLGGGGTSFQLYMNFLFPLASYPMGGIISKC